MARLEALLLEMTRGVQHSTKKKKPWVATAGPAALLLEALLEALLLEMEMTRGVTHAGQGLPAAASACLNSLPAVCIQEEEECLSARFPPRKARATHYHCATLQSAAPAAAAYRTLKVAGAKELKAAAARQQ